MPGIPFAFWQASWSDPLGFAPGALRGRPATAPAGSTLLLRQTIAATSALAKIISVTTTWTGVSSQLRSGGYSAAGNLTSATRPRCSGPPTRP